MTYKLGLALENDEENEDVTEVVTTPDEIIEGTEEILDDGGEIEDMTDGVDEALDASNELEQVEGIVQSGVESGEGISQDAAEMVQVAVESIQRRLHLPKKYCVSLPAMESFGGNETRRVSTQLALESIRDTAMNVWAGMKKFFSELVKNVMAWYDKHIALNGRLAKWAKDLKEATGKKNFGGKVGPSISAPKAVAAFGYGGPVTANNIFKILSTSGPESIDSLRMTFISMNQKVIERATVENSTFRSNSQKYSKDMSKVYQGEVLKLITDGLGVAAGASKDFGPFVGNQIVNVKIGSPDEFSLVVTSKTKPGSGNKESQIPTFTGAEISQILDEAIKITTNNQSDKVSRKGLEEQWSKLDKLLDNSMAVAKALGDEFPEGVLDSMKKGRKLLTAAFNGTIKISKIAPECKMIGVSAALGAVKASLNAYEEP